MTLRATVTSPDMERLAKDIPTVDPAMVKEVLVVLTRASVAGWGVAREEAPKFLGHLGGSIQAVPGSIVRQSSEGFDAESDFHTGALPWAEPMEYGRPAGKSPPPEAIYRWVQLKVRRGQFPLSNRRSGQSLGDAIADAAWAVARSIGRYGTPPHDFMLMGEKAALKELDKLIERGVKVATDRVATGKR